MNPILIISIIVAFITTYLLTLWFIKYLKAIGLIVKDQNKESKPLIPISGGLPVLCGFILGTFVLIFLNVFLPIFSDNLLAYEEISLIFASLCSMFIIVLVGLIDDLMIKKDKNASAGLNQWQKPLLTLFAAIPLMVVNAGEHTLTLPFLGSVSFGWVYPLLLIPIGVIGASNMVNMLAGFNGLETSLGIVYLTSLGIFAFVNNSPLAGTLAFIMVASLIAFLIFNKYPAKIFPGNSLTYLLGASILVTAVIGNIERAAIIAAIPFFIEFFLKLRGNFKKQSYGYGKNGKVLNTYKKEVYSIPHFFTRTGKFTEKQTVFFTVLIELFFCLLIWFI